MLTIRKSLLDAFAQGQESDFEERLVKFLRHNFDDAALEEKSKLLAGVRALVRQAGAYGIETEQDIAVFCTTAWLLGDDFPEEFPAAGQALVNPEFSGHLKAEWLANWTEKLFAALEAKE